MSCMGIHDWLTSGVVPWDTHVSPESSLLVPAVHLEQTQLCIEVRGPRCGHSGGAFSACFLGWQLHWKAFCLRSKNAVSVTNNCPCPLQSLSLPSLTWSSYWISAFRGCIIHFIWLCAVLEMQAAKCLSIINQRISYLFFFSPNLAKPKVRDNKPWIHFHKQTTTKTTTNILCKCVPAVAGLNLWQQHKTKLFSRRKLQKHCARGSGSSKRFALSGLWEANWKRKGVGGDVNDNWGLCIVSACSQHLAQPMGFAISVFSAMAVWKSNAWEA